MGAQLVKPKPADLTVPGSRPAGDGDLFNCKLKLSPSHHLDMTEILFKWM